MRNLLDSKQCAKFSPSFDNRECDYYQFPEDDAMNIKHGECGYCKLPNAYRCIADVTRIIPLSHSSIETFCTCHYLYYLTRILGVEIRPPFLSIPLKAGQLWDQTKQRQLGNEKINIKETINQSSSHLGLIVTAVKELTGLYTRRRQKRNEDENTKTKRDKKE